MVANIDELNNLTPYENKITDIDKWLEDFYKVMPISEDQKERRMRIASQVRESFLFLFSLLYTMAETNSWNYEIALLAFRNDFRNSIAEYVKLDAYLENYIQEFTQKYLDTTLEHLSESDASFFFSDDRAIIGSANEGNAIVGYEELKEAIEDGCTMKRWRTEMDNRVRRTHREMEGKTIPIDDYFVVGDGTLLFYPCDPECDDEKETANCRCVCEYL